MEQNLKELLDTARAKVPVGARYTHYKNSGHTYVIKALALTESTLLPAVVYEAEYGDKLSFIRLLDNFLEVIDVNGAPTSRFSRISEPGQGTE